MKGDIPAPSKGVYAGETVLGAVQAAVLFVPVSFLQNIILWVEGLSFFSFLAIGVSALLYGIALVSRSVRQLILKWLISLPLMVALWYYFVETRFAVRSLNWVTPGYGAMSAGSSFACSVLLIIQWGCCLLAWCIACFYSGKPKSEKAQRLLRILQKAVCSVICVGIIVLAVILEQMFPRYIE